MEACNVVVLCGRVSSEPQSRQLPSGSTMLQFDLTTRTAAGSASAPVVWSDPATSVTCGTDVVVVGQVRRRFFRAGGVTRGASELAPERVKRPSSGVN